MIYALFNQQESTMPKVKTNELAGAALDWTVAKLERRNPILVGGRVMRMPQSKFHTPRWLDYSTDWAQSGPIIERIKGLEIKHWLESKFENCCEAHIHNYDGDWIAFGPTVLIAIMRCYVISKLGDEVELPDGLL